MSQNPVKSNQYTIQKVMQRLNSLASHDPKDLVGMARFGIKIDKAWVISIPKLRLLAGEIKRNNPGKERHLLAQKLWESDIHEARLLAGLSDVPELVTEEQMENWVLDFDSWDIVDMVCGNLFDRTSFAYEKAIKWSKRPEEFVKRAGFVLMATLSVHDKETKDLKFDPFFEAIKREAIDDRNFVRKAVNWALRQIGKSRNKSLYQKSLVVAQEIIDKYPDSKSAKWIANDAIRELNADYIKKKFIN